jgi:hypothetical protein
MEEFGTVSLRMSALVYIAAGAKRMAHSARVSSRAITPKRPSRQSSRKGAIGLMVVLLPDRNNAAPLLYFYPARF